MKKYILLTILVLFPIILLSESETIDRVELKTMIRNGESVTDSIVIEAYLSEIREEIKQDSINHVNDSLKAIQDSVIRIQNINFLKNLGYEMDGSLADFEKLYPAKDYGVNKAKYEHSQYADVTKRIDWLIQCYKAR
jgi:hypothetical protein